MTTRNQQGDLIFTTRRSEFAELDPTLVQTLGVRWCLAIAKERELPQPTVVTNASVVVDCILGKLERASIDPIIQD